VEPHVGALVVRRNHQKNDGWDKGDVGKAAGGAFRKSFAEFFGHVSSFDFET